MTDREKAIVMAYTGVAMLCGDKLDIFYQYVSEKLGYCIMTHELAFPEVQDAITDAAKNDFIELCKGHDASTVDGWVSVKDRPPEEKQNPVTLDFNEIVCFCDFGGDPKRTDVRTCKFGTKLGDTRPHFWHGPQIMDGVVTHWQYLPEPPKEET